MRTALVTGACINTGKDIVEKFLSEGFRVIFTGRNLEKVKKAEALYKEEFPKGEVMGFELNAVDENAVVDEKGVKDLFKNLDKLNIFVDTVVLNAADLGIGIKIFENPLVDFMKVINTNMTWDYLICEESARRMKENGGGSITFINSNTAYRVIPDRIAYSASKSGQLGLMRALAFDLGKFGIRVNAVLPGMIVTDRWAKNPDVYINSPSRFTPLGKVAKGKDIADAAWYFAALANNTTGAELVVDGGNTIQLYPVVPEDMSSVPLDI